jgi:peptidoglycan/xylan/chitin deacetylase (PgdA/CDA1 family)
VVVTLDDGMRGNYALLGLFRRYGVVPTIYVCSQLVGTNRHFWTEVRPDREALKVMPHEERVRRLEEEGTFTLTVEYPAEARMALSNAEIAEMRESVDFQSHTRFHPILTTCSDEDCVDEIAGSRVEVEKLVGKPCRHFSYPNGDYTERELQLVRESGYRSARTINVGWTGPRSDPYQLKILGVDDRASVNQLAADLAGFGFVRRARLTNLSGRRKPITLADRV